MRAACLYARQTSQIAAKLHGHNTPLYPPLLCIYLQHDEDTTEPTVGRSSEWTRVMRTTFTSVSPTLGPVNASFGSDTLNRTSVKKPSQPHPDRSATPATDPSDATAVALRVRQLSVLITDESRTLRGTANEPDSRETAWS